MAESQHALRRFERRPHALTWVAGLLTAFAVLLLLGARAPAAPAAKPKRGDRSPRPLGAPRNFEAGRRTTTSIALHWMRARGGARPHTYLLYLDHRLRIRTRRKAAVLKGLRCGHRYRIWLAARDRKGH